LKDELCRALVPHRLHQIDNERPINGRINRVYLGDIKIHAMHVGPAVQVMPVKLESSYMVHMPVQGRTGFEIGGLSFVAEARRAAIMSPGITLSSRWFQGCSAILISIDKKLLEFHLEKFLDTVPRSPVIFEPILELANGKGRSWKRLWDYLLMQLQANRKGTWNEKWGSDAVSLIIDALLLNARHSYSDSLTDCRSRQAPHYLRRAENFMYENAADRISLEDVAEYAGVSSRTLRNAFVRYRGLPPIKALLHLRLDGARAALLRGGTGITITQIATRWGFRELGRFSVAYRQRFNESPSQTLQRQHPPF
jgi:AraC-like DNA-binding protein